MTGQPFQWPRTGPGCPDCPHPEHYGRCPRSFGDVAGVPSTAHPCRCVTRPDTGRTTAQEVDDLLRVVGGTSVATIEAERREEKRGRAA